MHGLKCTALGVRDESREGMGVGSPSPAPAVASLGAPVRLCWLTMDGHRVGLHCALSHMAESRAPLFSLHHVVRVPERN